MSKGASRADMTSTDGAVAGQSHDASPSLRWARRTNMTHRSDSQLTGWFHTSPADARLIFRLGGWNILHEPGDPRAGPAGAGPADPGPLRWRRGVGFGHLHRRVGATPQARVVSLHLRDDGLAGVAFGRRCGRCNSGHDDARADGHGRPALGRAEPAAQDLDEAPQRGSATGLHLHRGRDRGSDQKKAERPGTSALVLPDDSLGHGLGCR